MRRSRHGLASAVGLLTVLGGPADPTPSAVPWFPVVGGGIGVLLGALWWCLGRVLPAFVTGAAVLAADLALTGLLHADGLVDAADGLLPHLDRSRRLEIMAEPTVGAFGIFVAGSVFGLRLAALASGGPPHLLGSVLLLGALWTSSRAVMGIATAKLPYARDSGMGTLYGGSPTPSTGSGRVALQIVALAAALGALVAWKPVAALPVLAAVLLGAGAVLVLALRRLGGYTGDVLGAAGVVGETLGLVVAVARW